MTSPRNKIRIMHGAGDDFAHLESATAGQRLLANIIDNLIHMAVQGVFQAVLGRVGAPVTLSLAMAALTFFGYWVVGPAKFGTTPGKSFLNMRIVANSPTKHFGFIRALVREFSKVLSALLLMMGYLMIFIGSRRRGLHDLISGTRVITTVPIPPLTFGGLVRNVGLTVFFITLPLVGLAWVGIYTSYPLRGIQENLELQGFKVRGVEGSLAKGITLLGLQKSDETMDLGVDRLFFLIPREAWLSPFTGEFVFGKLVVSGVRIKIKENAFKGLIQPNREEKAPEPQKEADNGKAPAKGKAPFTSVRVDLIDATEVSMTREGSKWQAEFERFHVKDIYVSEKKEIKVGRLYFASNLFDIDTKPIHFAEGKFVSPLTLYGQLKPALLPDVLVKSVDLQTSVEGSMEDYKVKLALGGGEIQALLSPRHATLKIRDFDPQSYFKESPIVKVESLVMEASSPITLVMAPTRATGSLLVGNKRFNVNPPAPLAGLSAIYTATQGNYELTSSPMAFVRRGSETLFMLRPPSAGTDSVTVEEVLAMIHFDVPIHQLQPEQMQVVEKQRAYFSLMPAAPIWERMPTSVFPVQPSHK